jgi:hypothetical protein
MSDYCHITSRVRSGRFSYPHSGRASSCTPRRRLRCTFLVHFAFIFGFWFDHLYIMYVLPLPLACSVPPPRAHACTYILMYAGQYEPILTKPPAYDDLQRCIVHVNLNKVRPD